MEYPQIISLVPLCEHFDASVVGEGIWISVAHFAAIENQLDEAAALIKEGVNLLNDANTQIAAAKQEANDATMGTEALQTENNDLKQQIADLKAGAAKPVTVTTTGADPFEGPTTVKSEVTAEAERLLAMKHGKN